MPGPIFWIITVLVAVLFCTGHFCAGLWVGRELFGRRVIRQAREALNVTVAEVDAQESAAESLLQQSEKLAASARQQKSPADIAADVEALQVAASALRDAMRAGKEHCREALAQLPEDKASRTDETTQTRVGRAKRKHEPGIEVEAQSNRDGATALVPSEEAVETDDSNAPPWSSLSPDELERFRTGFPSRQDSERADTRYPYGVMQYVAPVVGNSFPDAMEFQHVKCRDVSRRGVSYFSPEPPHTEQAILTLGGAPNLSFVCVRITNHRETVLDGETGYTIGCEFVARLAPGIYGWDPSTNSIATAAGEMVLEGCA